MGGPERLDLRGLGMREAAALGERLAAATLVCFPTDTVYGVGGTLTPVVAAALVAAKGRDPGKPLQVVFPSVRRLTADVAMAPLLRAACRALLPGPVTLVVPYPAGWRFPPPGLVVGEGGEVETLGLRVPDWPATARVLGSLELPLVASSANMSGAPPAASLDEVDPGLLARCDLALDAGPVGGVASSVVDLSAYGSRRRWRLLRVGAWDEAAVARRLAPAEEEQP